MKNATAQAQLQKLSELLQSDTVLPLAEAQVNLKHTAITGLSMAVATQDKSSANLVLDWWMQADKRIARAIANAETVKTSLREVIAGE